MAKKVKGYIELYWSCANCGNENLGSNRYCTSCGNPQPQNVDFHQGSKQQILTDAQKIKQAKAGADVYCGSCGTRNDASNAKCTQCGSELKGAAKRASAGKVVGAYSAGAPDTVTCANCGSKNPGSRLKCQNCGSSLRHGAPTKTKAAPSSPSVPVNKSALAIGAALILLLCAAVYFLFLRTETLTAVVSDVRWERSVVIEAFDAVQQEDWRSDLPADAENVSCSQEVSYVQSEPPSSGRYDEVCGTPYTVETGSGFAEVVQDCEYQVYEDYCSFTTYTWTNLRTVEVDGSSLSPQWPSPSLSSNQRLGEQSASYACIFEADGNTYTYTTESLQEFQRCEIGSRWQLTVNGAGSVVSIER
jgi:hypothetical protein